MKEQEVAMLAIIEANKEYFPTLTIKSKMKKHTQLWLPHFIIDLVGGNRTEYGHIKRIKMVKENFFRS